MRGVLSEGDRAQQAAEKAARIRADRIQRSRNRRLSRKAAGICFDCNNLACGKSRCDDCSKRHRGLVPRTGGLSPAMDYGEIAVAVGTTRSRARWEAANALRKLHRKYKAIGVEISDGMFVDKVMENESISERWRLYSALDAKRRIANTRQALVRIMETDKEPDLEFNAFGVAEELKKLESLVDLELLRLGHWEAA